MFSIKNHPRYCFGDPFERFERALTERNMNMRVHLNEEDLKVITVYAGADIMDFKAQTDQQGNPKLTDGRPAFSIPNVLVYETAANGNERQLKAAYVKVFNAPSKPLSRFERLEFEGEVTAKVWVSDGNLGLSIIADGLKSPAKKSE